METNNQKAYIVILTAEKIDLKTKAITRDKGHDIIIKG